MKTLVPFFLTVGAISAATAAEEEPGSDRAANTIILDELGVKNLGIETTQVTETDFEQTIFALGRVETIPKKRAVVSSRIAGRVKEMRVQVGDRVEKDETIVLVESRQFGDAPRIIELKAPIGGLVTETHVTLGEPVEPANEMLDIIDMTEVYAVARVPEDEASRIKKGMTSRIVVAALANESFEGELLRFGTSADVKSGTIDAVFMLENPEEKIRPNMRAEFSIIVSNREDVMAVPQRALQGDAANRIVFVKDFELKNAFVKSRVVTGERNDKFVEIVSGLFPGDEVVTKGAYMLSFAGGGTISLKEALDAAHGHEHNEDGSEMTPEEKTAREAGKAGAHSNEESGSMNTMLAVYAGVVTLLFVGAAQMLWSRRKATA